MPLRSLFEPRYDMVADCRRHAEMPVFATIRLSYIDTHLLCSFIVAYAIVIPRLARLPLMSFRCCCRRAMALIACRHDDA